MFRTLTNATTSLALLAVAGLHPGVSAAATTSDFDHHVLELVGEAKKVQLEAEQIAETLKPKRPDFDRVNSMMDSLVRHVGSVKSMVGVIEGKAGSFDADQKKHLDLMKTKADLLEVFAANKQNILAGDDAGKKRDLLRAKANGIALRAEMLQRTALKIRE